MKLHRDTPDNIRLITAYDAKQIVVDDEKHAQSLVVTPDQVIAPWCVAGFDQLCEADFAPIVALKPALVLLGTGVRQRFPKPAVLRLLIDAGIGFEVMDTGSACRTYNLLASEGRVVAAALLIDSSA